MRRGRIRLQRWLFSLAFVLLAPGAVLQAGAKPARADAAPSQDRFEVVGARVEVTEIPAAVKFYALGLGFELVEQGTESAILRNGSFVLGLRESEELSKVRFPGDAETHILFHVGHIKRTLERLASEEKVAVVENIPQLNESGVFLTIKDRSGNVQELMEYWPRHEDLPKPEVLELAVEVTNLKQARDFYCNKLGFAAGETGEDPPSLKLKQAGAAAIRLRETAARPSSMVYRREAATILLLGTRDLPAGMAALKKRGIEFLGPAQDSPLGRYAAFKDPFGNVLELLQEDHARTTAKPPVADHKGSDPLQLESIFIKAGDGSRIKAELARFSVAENRTRPGGKRLELAFVRFKSTAQKPGAPIVYLAGGPGGSGIAAAKGSRLPLFLALREIGDVIALDQRGTGLSRPDLTCSGSWSGPLDRPSDPEQILTEAGERSWTCSRTLRAAGIDLSSYNTNESADDLEDLRRVLGVPKISLLGVSYGTHLALATVRRHEGSLQSVVLAGVEGPDQVLRLPSKLEGQLATISDLLKSGPGSVGTAPDLPAAIGKLARRLDDKPATVQVFIPLAQNKSQVTVGKFDLQWMVVQALGSREGIRQLPGKIQAMEKDDFSSLGSFAVGARRGWLGSAMPYAVQCASLGSPERLERIKREESQTLLGRAVGFPFPEICEAWGVADLGPAFRTPVRADLPALFISGTLDTRTPASDAEEVRQNFSHGVHVLIDGAGHGDDLLLSSPEISHLIARFLRGEAVAETRIAVAPAP